MKKLIISMILTLAALTATVLPVSADYYGDYYGEYYYDDYYDEDDGGGIGLGTVGISLAVGFGISFAIVSVQKSAMKTVKSQRAARNYINEGSLNLTDRSEMYIRTSVTRIPRKKNR